MKILNEMKDETENEIARCIEEESRIKDTFEKGQNEYTVTRNAINKRETELGDILKRYSERLLKKLNTESNMTEKMISSRQTEVAEHRKKLEKKKDSINEILPSQQVLKILKASRTPCEKLMTTKYIYQRKFKQTKVVICQKVTEYTLQNLFGDLYAGPEYKLVQSLKTDLKDISKLLYYEKDRLIFSSVTEELLQQVKIENNDIVVEKQIKDYEVYDMALMKNGMILLSMKSTKLNVWDCEGKLRLFHSFESFYTYGLHVSKENEILVGLSSSNVVSECDRSGKVLVLNSKKHVVKTYEHDTETKQKLFKCPLRIVTNYDKTICVIDVDGSPRNKRRVLCLSQEGTLKWKYEGSNSLNFEPYDLTTTTDGLIFVLDLYRTIHCFDQEGSLSSRKPCHAQSPSNLPFYHTLAIGFEGLLLVGQTNESHTKSEINVYELK